MTDRGSALILMPAGTLIVLLLGSIAVDFSAWHLAQRQLTAAAEAAVNDAVTFGLDEPRLRAGEGYQLDVRRTEEAVRRAVAGTDLGGVRIHVQVVAPTTVRVALRDEVRLVFAPVLPMVAGTVSVEAHATATLQGST